VYQQRTSAMLYFMQNLDSIRHTLAHLLASAVLEIWPDAKRTIGPAIDNGFYYDFEFSSPISDSDLPKIEAKMKQILPSWNEFSHREVTEKEAREFFKDNPYKLELIDEIISKGEKITLYTSGTFTPLEARAKVATGIGGTLPLTGFTDLCRGGHVENPSEIPLDSFKLDKLAGAYWRGDEKNKQLTRIYGLAFASGKEIADYLAMMEEAKKRDHRKLGKDLGLFVFSDLVGKGLPTFGPKGATIKRELERFTIDEELKRGYNHVITPDLAKVDLYKKSGHYPYYKDTMYPVMKIDEEELILKPMTCPHHFMFYKSAPHSYRDLPYRIGEIAHQYRYEKSGELSGLTRVRMFCLADAHIIATKDQAKQVIKEVLELIDFINKTLGLVKGTDYRYRLSLGDRSDTKKYYKDDAAWDKAEDILRQVLKEMNAPFFEAENEAAFYGPKIDIQMKNFSGKEETAFTVQYDFVMPKRFNLTYIDEKGLEQEALVVHRSSLGAFERVMAFLIEHTGGAFPLWLSPIQVQIIPIADRHQEYAQKVLEQLKSSNIRVEIDNRAEKMQAKIRDAQMQKIPYMIIVGDREEEEGKIAVRTRSGENLGITTEEFLTRIKREVENKS